VYWGNRMRTGGNCEVIYISRVHAVSIPSMEITQMGCVTTNERKASQQTNHAQPSHPMPHEGTVQ
jgi:hypothetical protein